MKIFVAYRFMKKENVGYGNCVLDIGETMISEDEDIKKLARHIFEYNSEFFKEGANILILNMIPLPINP